jgi:DNA-binding MarR family transcriptional regulator
MGELEEEIKQKKFTSAQHKAVINIIYTAGWLSSVNAKLMKPYAISPEQYNVLRILRGQHPSPASVGLVQERMLDKSSNASRLIDKLKLKGLVERHECPRDRRQVDVIITGKGLDLLKEMDKTLSAPMQDLFKTISEKDANELNRILDKLRG